MTYPSRKPRHENSSSPGLQTVIYNLFASGWPVLLALSLALLLLQPSSVPKPQTQSKFITLMDQRYPIFNKAIDLAKTIAQSQRGAYCFKKLDPYHTFNDTIEDLLFPNLILTVKSLHERDTAQSLYDYDSPSEITLSRKHVENLLINQWPDNPKEVELQLAISILHQMAHWRWYVSRFNSPTDDARRYKSSITKPQNPDILPHEPEAGRYLEHCLFGTTIYPELPTRSKYYQGPLSALSLQKVNDFTNPEYWNLLFGIPPAARRDPLIKALKLKGHVNTDLILHLKIRSFAENLLVPKEKFIAPLHLLVKTRHGLIRTAEYVFKTYGARDVSILGRNEKMELDVKLADLVDEELMKDVDQVQVLYRYFSDGVDEASTGWIGVRTMSSQRKKFRK